MFPEGGALLGCKPPAAKLLAVFHFFVLVGARPQSAAKLKRILAASPALWRPLMGLGGSFEALKAKSSLLGARL